MSGRLLHYRPTIASAEPAVSAPPISALVGVDDVRAIATPGFPLDEEHAALILRNRRVTLGYASLARQLTELYQVHEPAVTVANWCTFAAWSSKTIGASINPDELPPVLRESRLPWRSQMARALQRHTGRDHGAVFRSLAAGNRLIFLEIGLVVATFLEEFADLTDLLSSREGQEGCWRQYWARCEELAAEFARLDATWVPSEPVDVEMLRSGMRLYFDALLEPDRDRKVELVLAANLELGGYEQGRAEGYVHTSLALDCGKAFQRLMINRSGLSTRWAMRMINRVWSRLLTRFALAILVPDGIVRIGRPLRSCRPRWAPQDPRLATLFRGDVRTIDEPVARDLLRRFDLDGDRDDRKRGARNWASYAERMHFIANLFRARHEDVGLIDAELFNDDEAADICAGRLSMGLLPTT